MTKEISKKPKLKKEEDEPHLKTLKKIKKHKSDKPPKPHSPDPYKLNHRPPGSDSDSIKTSLKKKKKKHKSDEPKSLNPGELDSKTPDSDSMQNTIKKKKKKKKKKEKLDEPLSLDPETPDSGSTQNSKKKKKHKSDKPSKPHSPDPDKSDLEEEKKKKKKERENKSDKPHKSHSLKYEKCYSEIAADSIRTQKKKKQKLDKPHILNPEILDSEIDTNSIQSPKKKKKRKLDESQSSNPEKNSEIDTDTIQTPKRKKKRKLDQSQTPKPEIPDSEAGTDTIQISKKKKEKLDDSQKPLSVNREMLDSEIDSDSIHNLLEPHTKDQLIEFLLDSAAKTPSILSKIIETANQDISHRRIFVHNLDWDTTKESVVSVFEKYGELEACDVVYDRVTGKTKGFGFVIFKSRECAKNALKEPRKRIDNRTVSCQLASIGPPVVGCVDNSSRKIYVSNVEKDVDSGKLREFFEKFGEIEVGPLGFDMQTGKSKGYALFVYKNLEGVRKVLEEPDKFFDGKLLNCRMANDWNGRKKNCKSDSSITTVMMPVPHDLSAVLPQQNMAMFGQHAGLNPMLGQSGFNSIAEGLYANPIAGLLNQLLSQTGIGVNQFGQTGVGLGGYGESMAGQGMGSFDWNQSALRSFNGSPSAPLLQGWQHAYPDI